MSSPKPIRIANVSGNPNLDWCWIRDLIDRDFVIGDRPLRWSNFSLSAKQQFANPRAVKLARRFPGLARCAGAAAFAAAAQQTPFDLIVSHGPWVPSWVEYAMRVRRTNRTARHFGFSFNFTDLPTGLRYQLMARSFRQVDLLTVFTEAELDLYQEYFRLDRQTILRAPWGVAAPLRSPPPRLIEGEYFAALGGEARDYETLCEAARRCPDTKFVVIARPKNFQHVDPPANLSVHFNLPYAEAWGILWHAVASIISLRSRDTPCGLVTLIGTMHLGKAQIVTHSVGVAEYVRDGESGILVAPRDPQAMVEAIRRLRENPELRCRLGNQARIQATANYNEAATVEFFKDRLQEWFGKLD